MIDPKRIERGMWWDRAWTLTRGCSVVSAGCDHCWAAEQSHMRANNPAVAAQYGCTCADGSWSGQVEFLPQNLGKPLTVRKPSTWAVWNDLFHESISFGDIDQAMGVMALAAQHSYIVLTKRIDRALLWYRYMAELVKDDPWKCETEEYLISMLGANENSDPAVINASSKWLNMWNARHLGWPLPNLIIGFTAESQAEFDARWEYARQIPAACIMVSHEPALGPITYPADFLARGSRAWIVTGGESGKGARPMHPDWARWDRDQAVGAGVPFFFKQWGEWIDRGSSAGYRDEQGNGTAVRRDAKIEGRSILPDGTLTGIQITVSEQKRRGLNYDIILQPGFAKLRQLLREIDLLPQCGFGGAIPSPEFEELQKQLNLAWMFRVGKKAAGRLLDGRVWDELPSMMGYRMCCNPSCDWEGMISDTVHPKHDESSLLCPVCYEVTE